MEIICENKLEQLLRKFHFYNFEELLSNEKNYVIKFKEKVSQITFNDITMGGDRSVYITKENILMNLVGKIVQISDKDGCTA